MRNGKSLEPEREKQKEEFIRKENNQGGYAQVMKDIQNEKKATTPKEKLKDFTFNQKDLVAKLPLNMVTSSDISAKESKEQKLEKSAIQETQKSTYSVSEVPNFKENGKQQGYWKLHAKTNANTEVNETFGNHNIDGDGENDKPKTDTIKIAPNVNIKKLLLDDSLEMNS